MDAAQRFHRRDRISWFHLRRMALHPYRPFSANLRQAEVPRACGKSAVREDFDRACGDDASVGGDQGQLVGARRRDQQAVDRIFMRQSETRSFERNSIGKYGFAETSQPYAFRHPFAEFLFDCRSSLGDHVMEFHDAQGRKPLLVPSVRKNLSQRFREPLFFKRSPDPDVGIEQKSQSFLKASYSSRGIAGSMRSPTMRPVPAMLPSQLLPAFPACLGASGAICATGFPNLVMTMGLRVLCTRSTTARQVALNFDTDIDWAAISYI